MKAHPQQIKNMVEIKTKAKTQKGENLSKPLVAQCRLNDPRKSAPIRPIRVQRALTLRTRGVFTNKLVVFSPCAA
jgi:hypothetical protein